MVDKKACKVRKRKYKVNGAVLITRLSMLFVICAVCITVYNKVGKNNVSGIVESSAYIDINGVSSMVKGVENGGVYTDSVEPIVTSAVKKATLTRDGEGIKFKSGKKISKMGSYILTLEDKSGNVDTIYFDIEI